MRRSVHRRLTRRRGRPGFALVVALALLALSAALLVGALAISSAQVRSVRSERAALEAEAGARHALAAALADWGGEFDSLAIGKGFVRELSPSERGTSQGGMPVAGRLRVHQLSAGLYAVVVDVSIGAAPTLARQRLRLLVTRPELPAAIDSSSATAGDSGTVFFHVRGAPTPISRWSVADLY